MDDLDPRHELAMLRRTAGDIGFKDRALARLDEEIAASWRTHDYFIEGLKYARAIISDL